MLWTISGLYLLYALGVITGAALVVFCMGKSRWWALGGLVVAIAAMLGTLFILMRWLGVAGGGG